MPKIVFCRHHHISLAYLVIQLEAESLHADRTKLEEELASAQVQYVNTIRS